MSLNRNTFEDVAAILYPLPERPDHCDDDLYSDMCSGVFDNRQSAIAQWELNWEHGDTDPLLGALRHAQARRSEAEQDIRLLLAYGREFVAPRPYTLGDLADAAGMSVSGIRTGYDHHDVAAVAETTGAKPREWRASDPSDDAPVQEMRNDLDRRHSGGEPGRPTQVYGVLLTDGWTPHVPESRTPGTKATKRYLRWERSWPAGTRVTLYQEADTLAASGKIQQDDPRRFHVDYAATDPHEVWAQLAEFTKAIADHDAARATTLQAGQ